MKYLQRFSLLLLTIIFMIGMISCSPEMWMHSYDRIADEPTECLFFNRKRLEIIDSCKIYGKNRITITISGYELDPLDTNKIYPRYRKDTTLYRRFNEYTALPYTLPAMELERFDKVWILMYWPAEHFSKKKQLIENEDRSARCEIYYEPKKTKDSVLRFYTL